ncbi:MAG: hypothetical protein JWP73_1989, partial [Phenylobacterium sp.]|nr:hypothetical protein [Phenylobacterium sp.]
MAESHGAEQAAEAEETVSSNAAAVAVALDEARSDSTLAGDVRDFLRRQSRLTDEQREHLREQFKHLKLKYFIERMKAAMQIFVALGATVIALFVIGLVWHAATDKGLVIDAFSAPPDLAAKGLNGQVVASQMEDKLSALQAATESTRAAASYSNDWGHEIKVEIPATGVSISELQRYLRQWLGHESHIGGEVFHTADGLRVTVRAGGEAGDSAAGPETDLDGILEKAAEALFARTQPYRYGVFLAQNGRQAEALAFYQRFAATAAPEERPWALIGLGLMQRDFRNEANRYRQALALNPHLALAWDNLASAEGGLGHDEAALATTVRFLKELGRGDRGSVAAHVVDSLRLRAEISRAETLGDYRAALAAIGEVEAQPDFRAAHFQAQCQGAADLSALHDVAAARARLPQGSTDASLSVALLKVGQGECGSHTLIDMAAQDWPAALAELAGVEQMLPLALRQGVQVSDEAMAVTIWPVKARILAHLGRGVEAAALIAQTPSDCYDCLIARGEVAAELGQAATADRWFAEAVRQGPSLPKAEAAWAKAKLARGDAGGALNLALSANRKAPRFADALELKGEALAARGDATGAAAAYAAAAELAPRWGRLHL